MPGSVAAQVMAWQRRMRSVAGPLGASGEQSNGDPVMVEVLIDGLWTDITSRVMVRDGGQQIRLTTGQTSEGQAVQPGTCSFQLNNRDGLFSPRNPVSPYYGKIGRNTQIRVSVPKGNDKDYRFWGEVPSWPQNWDTTGTDIWVDMQAAGILRRLNQGSQPPLRSTMYRGLTSTAIMVSNPPVAYWPCEDGATATSIASALTGGQPMTILGTPTLASYTGFASSDAIPVMGSGAFVGAVPTYTTPATANAFQVRFLLAIPAGGATNGQRICSLACNGNIRRIDLVYGTGGTLTLKAYDGDGSNLINLGPLSFGVDGELLRVDIEFSKIGLTGDSSVTLATLQPGATSGLASTTTWTGFLAGHVTSVTMAPDGGLTNTAIGHVSVQAAISTIFDLGGQLAAYVGETAGARVQRLEGEQGIAFGSLGDLTTTPAMGAQGLQPLMTLISEAVAVDMGILYERWLALGLGYRTRTSIQNQTVGLALDYAANHLSEVPVPVDDDQLTRNDWTASRTAGSSARYTQDTGTLSTQDPPLGVGEYADSVTVNVQTDSQLPSQAGWRVHLGTVDEPRYPTITINLARAPFVATPQLRSDALGIHPGDRITVANMPTWVGPDALSLICIGRTETIDQFQHIISYACQPESPYRTGVVEGTYDLVDTDGSTLAADVAATDTVISVATQAGSATWTTDPTDTPWDLRVGGEIVTAYSIGQVLNANSEFEAGISGWTAFGGGSISYSTAKAKWGVGSCLLTTGGLASPRFEADKVTVTAGVVYRAVGWFYSDTDLSTSGGFGINVNWYDAGSGYLATSTNNLAAPTVGAWNLLDTVFTAPASAALAGIVASSGGTPAAGVLVYGDGIRLIPVSSYTSNPQSMTVTRSVNGVVKPHSASEDIRLAYPTIVDL
ncbi:MAG: hypothetical protein HOV92_18195 [Streptomyces sp.]|nr:hypothetical protein [Streptomyces sp.]